jgi:hypothetical protein
MAEAETANPSPDSRSNTAHNSGEVALTLSDIEAGLSALPRAKATRYIVWGGAVAVVAMVAYRWMEGRNHTSLVVIGVVLLGILAVNGNPAKRIAKKVYASLPDDAKTLRISVDETGFSVTSSGNESMLPWSEVQRCIETRQVLVVFVSRHDGQILPKRAFSEADLRSVREWSKTKIVRRHVPAQPWLTPEVRSRMLIWLVVFALVWTGLIMYGKR